LQCWHRKSIANLLSPGVFILEHGEVSVKQGNYLKDALHLTDSNLAAHLHKFEEAGYVMMG
jgi:DNA-binding MarR family transcriptional regulator